MSSIVVCGGSVIGLSAAMMLARARATTRSGPPPAPGSPPPGLSVVISVADPDEVLADLLHRRGVPARGIPLLRRDHPRSGATPLGHPHLPSLGFRFQEIS